MGKKRSSLLRVVGLLAVCLIMINFGVLIDRFVLTAYVPLAQIPENVTDDFRLMAEAWNTIEQYYVDRSAVKPRLMTYGALSGMVDSLGDTGHSTFLTPEMVKAEHEFSEGRFQGIGAEVQMKNGRVVIVAPIDGSPAQEAGLKSGDIIVEVNGKSVSGLPLLKVVKRITGPAGTSVTLTILNPGTNKSRQVTIKRASISVHNVTWQRLPGTSIADLRIAAFSEGVTDDLKRALKEIKQAGLNGIILDLRNDPGGLLDEAIGTASQFLTAGNVLLEKDAKGAIQSVKVRPHGVAPNIDMVVLINGGTASAAEIVAGALEDAKRASLVGETTFGTGTVLREFSLSDGSALLLAVEEWLTPDGHTIWHKGITPNYQVSLDPDVTPVIPSVARRMTEAQLKASGDDQLLKALSLLSSPSRSAAR